MSNSNPFDMPPKPLHVPGYESGESTPAADSLAFLDQNDFDDELAFRQYISAFPAWRKGDRLMIRLGDRLCDRCNQCNKYVDDARESRRFRAPRKGGLALAILGITYIPILWVLAFFRYATRKEVVLEIGCCELHQRHHQRLQRKHRTVTQITTGLGILILIVGIALLNGWLAALGLATIIGGSCYFVMAARILTVESLDEHFIVLKGCSIDYMENYPLYPSHN